MSMMPPVTPHSARDSVRNSVLQVRNYTDDEYAQHPPPPFQQDQDYNGDDDHFFDPDILDMDEQYAPEDRVQPHLVDYANPMEALTDLEFVKN